MWWNLGRFRHKTVLWLRLCAPNWAPRRRLSSVRALAAAAPALAAILDDPKHVATPGEFELFKDARGEFRFHVKAANGEIIAGSEG